MIRFHEGLADLMVPAGVLTPHPENANNGDIEEIVASIIKSGCYRPIYAAKDSGRIVAGHHLYHALLEMGAQMVPVVWIDGDIEAERVIMVGDNRIAALAKMDETQLLTLLNQIEADNGSLVGTGFTEREKDRLTLKLLQEQEAPLEINLKGAEQLTHTITCPNCHYEWVRGASALDG